MFFPKNTPTISQTISTNYPPQYLAEIQESSHSINIWDSALLIQSSHPNESLDSIKNALQSHFTQNNFTSFHE